jgi:hypothetical protein
MEDIADMRTAAETLHEVWEIAEAESQKLANCLVQGAAT